MTGYSTWWRRLGGLLAALVLVVLALGPGLDTMVCGGEGGMSAAAAESVGADHSTAVSADIGHAGDQDHDQGLDPCIHGHCHHSAAYVPIGLGAVPEAQVLPARHVIALATVTALDRKFQLKRPPRA